MATNYYDAEAFQKVASLHKKQLSLIHLNAQSLQNKKESVDLLLNNLNHRFDFLAFTETWSIDNRDNIQFTNYSCASICRENKRGGGVSIYVHESVKYNIVEEYTVISTHFESVMVKCQSLLVAALYRPPSGAMTNFLDFIYEMLEYCEKSGARAIITGDFNIDMLSSSCNKQNFLDQMLSFGYENTIYVATRITQLTETALDLCFTNCKNEVCAGVLTAGVSDHLPIFAFFTWAIKQRSPVNPTHYRKINQENIKVFQNVIARESWNGVYNNADPVSAYDIFITKITELYDLAFPFVAYKKPKKARKPWIDAALLKRMKARDKLFTEFIKSKRLKYLMEFKQVRNKLASDIKKARINYYENKFANILNDQKAIWNTINDLLQHKNTKTISEVQIEGRSYSGTQLAHMFNDHFLRSGASDTSVGAVQPYKSYITACIPESIFLTPTDESEVALLIKNLNNNSAAGFDGLKAEPLKAVSENISAPFSHICNLILNTGTFPDKLKVAKVSVIHKGGDENDMGNYRPISVLPIFSKIIERVIYVRFANFCSSKKVITEHQYGFQKNKFTEKALLSIKDKIIDNFEQKRLTIGIFLDFKKAFDSIKHEILLQKITEYGIRGSSLNLIRSYLSNRFQYTDMKHSKSEMGKINYGVPQGSILGPLLFLLYINDIVNVPLTADIILYADDTNVFFSGQDISSIEKQANLWLNNLSLWLKINQLELNIKKTKYIIFHPRNHSILRNTQLSFRGVSIERVQTQKFLGVIFHETLNWSSHIDKLRTQVSRSIGVIGKIRCFLPLWVTKQLYYALVYSRIQYCLLIWGSTTKTNKIGIHRLQKRMLRIIENVPRRTPSAPLFLKHGILTFENIFHKKLATVIYDQIKSNAVKFHDAYSRKLPMYNFRRTTYYSERTRTNYGRQKLAHLIPSFLNSNTMATTIVNESQSPAIFKKKIHAYLLMLQT